MGWSINLLLVNLPAAFLGNFDTVEYIEACWKQNLELVMRIGLNSKNMLKSVKESTNRLFELAERRGLAALQTWVSLWKNRQYYWGGISIINYILITACFILRAYFIGRWWLRLSFSINLLDKNHQKHHIVCKSTEYRVMVLKFKKYIESKLFFLIHTF
jgi:hypothetical protein